VKIPRTDAALVAAARVGLRSPATPFANVNTPEI
jgi:hypothetical protein